MAIVAMRHLRLIGLQAEREEMLRQLQHLGCLEITEPGMAQDDPLIQRLRISGSPELAKAREQYTAAEQALQTLAEHTPKEKNKLAPLPEIAEKALTDETELTGGREAARRLNDCRSELAALQSRSDKLAAEEAQLLPWEGLATPLECATTEKVLIQLGTLPGTVSPEEIREALDAAGDLYEYAEASADRERRYAMITVHISQAEDHIAALKALGWSRVTLGERTGTAAENLTALRREQTAIAQRRTELEQQITGEAGERPQLRQLSDAARIEMDRGEARQRTMETAETFLLEGWFPAENTKELEMLLECKTCAWQMTDPEPEDYPRVPVKLKNGRLTRPLNMVTEMYSLPLYGTLDPNPYMAPFFILFYGIMMADMGYGLLMMLIGLVILKKKRPREGFMKYFAELIFEGGVATFLMGILTAGFFGDAATHVVKLFNPDSTFTWFWKPLFDPLRDTIYVLIGAMILGFIHLITGQIIGMKYRAQHGEGVDAFWEIVPWWVIFAGIGLMVAGIGNIGGVPVVLAVGVLMMVFGAARGAKGFGKVTAVFSSLYNGLTGWFGDILSYSRLMALMLAGSVIAQVFNTLGALPGNIIVFAIIFLIGHALNFGLNLLGCYVHDLRLQCLEFFGKFYIDGGKPFKPLAFNTKYVDIVNK